LQITLTIFIETLQLQKTAIDVKIEAWGNDC